MRDPLTLLDALETHPGQFDFYGALRQLECAFAHLPRIGQAARPVDEAVRFGQQPSLAFEPSMIAGLKPGATPKLLLNFFGLLGANGPLPIHLTEYIRDRQRNLNDPTLAAFCDVFHHRMISLFYRAWASAQPTVSLDRPQTDDFARYLGALIGIGMPSLQARDSVADVAKLHVAGRLGPQVRNAEGLARVLGDYLGVPVAVEQFVGHWMALPSDGGCVLRSGPDAAVLGQTTVMGRKVWNAQHKFRLLIGPLDLAQTRRLLPGGDSLQRVQDWVHQYVGVAMEWDINLIVKKEHLPGLRLGSAPLGWTSWLRSRAPLKNDRQLLINPRRRPEHGAVFTSQGAAHG
ncbi:type VI secretion protein [Pseudomonas sp. S35]|uniref:type VI secretion system baseplate subunit TssG n=1 Tax=Pseudomonas sp. S35 TaxID=1573719 RepID=UPI00132EBD9E|nr:type VI secretion system baseplate subunit TssG [Pseudomonas sp. S35]QHF45561.1 type VI secretion protein [Pseudomonas sp. S35]